MIEMLSLLVSLPIVVLTVASAVSVTKPDSRFRDSKLLAIAEAGAAWCLGLIFVSGGMSKLMPFPGFMGPVWLEQELAPHGLAMFARFVAWAEAGIGLCLLLKQTRVIGAIMLVPLILNILMVTVSMEWQGTPWIVLIFLVSNIFLLTYHFERWQPIIDVTLRCISYRSDISRKWLPALLPIGTISIFSGPFVFLLSPTVAAIQIILGFALLLWNEFSSRFNRSVRTES